MRHCSMLAILSGAVVTLTASPLFAQEAPPAAPSEAPRRPSMLDRAVNDVRVSSWNVYGPNQTNSIVDATVQGRHALRVDVTTAGANPWDVGAGSLTNKPIATGDVLLPCVWARAERLPEGQASARLTIGLQMNAEPYTPLGSQDIEVGADWKLHFLQIAAARDYAAGQVGSSVHLARASQTIDLGPLFILDFGPGYDKSTLPTN